MPDDVKDAMFTYYASHKSVEEMLADELMLNTYTVVQDYVKERIALGDYEITGSGLFKILPKISMINQILSIDLAPLYSKILEYYESKREKFINNELGQNIEANGEENEISAFFLEKFTRTSHFMPPLSC